MFHEIIISSSCPSYLVTSLKLPPAYLTISLAPAHLTNDEWNIDLLFCSIALVCCMPTDWRSVLKAALFVMDVVLTSSRCLYSWNFATIGMGPVVLGLPSLCVRSRVMTVSISSLLAIKSLITFSQFSPFDSSNPWNKKFSLTRYH